MNKFDLRKYFEFNVLLESVEGDQFPYKDSRVAVDKSHFDNTKDIKKIEKILQILESVSNIKPIKRTTEVKNAFGGFEEKEDENGEIFYFKEPSEAIKFAFLLEGKKIDYSAAKHNFPKKN